MNTFKSLRTHNHLTLTTLAEHTGLSTSFLSDLERGRAQPSMKTLRKLATYYHVPISFFVDAPDAPTQTPVAVFQINHFVVFCCLKCGMTLEMKRYGEHHRMSSDHCPQCKACYVVNWNTPVEQSEVLLVSTVDREASPI